MSKRVIWRGWFSEQKAEFLLHRVIRSAASDAVKVDEGNWLPDTTGLLLVKLDSLLLSRRLAPVDFLAIMRWLTPLTTEEILFLEVSHAALPDNVEAAIKAIAATCIKRKLIVVPESSSDTVNS